MKLLLLRHGIGRCANLVFKFNSRFFHNLFSDFDVTPVYIQRPVKCIPATRSYPETNSDLQTPLSLLCSEQIIEVSPFTSTPDFKSMFKADHYNDNFSSFNNLFYQHETLRQGDANSRKN